jgi:hypothetical protein
MAALWYTGPSAIAVTVDGVARSLDVLSVTTNYFDVLGVPAFLGRSWTRTRTEATRLTSS